MARAKPEVVIKVASSAEEIDGAFQSRYRVFVEADRYFPPNKERRLYDRFDLYPLSTNFVAVSEGKVVGGLRFTDPSPVGSSCQEAYDFSPHVSRTSLPWGTGAWYFLEQEFRRNSRVAHGVLTLGYAWAIKRGWKQLYSIVNPTIVPGLVHHGYVPLADTQHDDKKGLPFVPMLLEFDALSPGTKALVEAIISQREVAEGQIRFRLEEPD